MGNLTSYYGASLITLIFCVIAFLNEYRADRFCLTSEIRNIHFMTAGHIHNLRLKMRCKVVKLFEKLVIKNHIFLPFTWL